MLAESGTAPVAAANDTFSEIVVTGQRREQSALAHSGSIELLDGALIDNVFHQHIHQLMTRVAGVWVSRGSGQEHLTAIRSPVLTGPGSCGAFLFLENGVPIRPAGFCNVNQLFEIDTEQAQSIEVIRGPGNALYGSNALHGIVNVLMPMQGNRSAAHGILEVGVNRFLRLQAELPGNPQSPHFAGFSLSDDGGFRDDSGYRQIKIHANTTRDFVDGEFTAAFSATDLDQETAGFIVGEDAYRDPAVNRSNPNPEAFRQAASQRLYGIWSKSTARYAIDVRPFLRHSDMRFLQHFLPGQPLEENGHVSAGVISALTFTADRHTSIAGIDVEWSRVDLTETQFAPAEGSDFLVETRPEGLHYDFEVVSAGIAAYIQSDVDITRDLTLAFGLRGEYLHYDYDNRMLDGNTREDGTPCGFGGCLYTRPADRTDSFFNLAPKASLNYRLAPMTALYLAAARGFRAPQMTELYRLQSGQQVADLDSERIDSVELGLRYDSELLSLDLAAFFMRKRNSVFRDAQGFNVNGARTRHDGVEAALDWQFAGAWSLAVGATYARHRYDFDTIAARGESFVSGRDVDTAPRWMGSTEISYDGGDRLRASLQWVSMGRYYIDAENRFDYPGHDLLNLRAAFGLTRSLTVTARLNNLADVDVADRADYAFGDYRYFPGRGRELFVEFRYVY
ncbi:MAG: TonB-dependent receptor [Gammaproteobacteria bacterium]|jgi:outer membrane receptor protein involved in Fe transport|nr:TonB-dependent receptor [Gammaproteobacteria bacterium]